MLKELIILILSLGLIIKGATWSTYYARKLAENFRLSKYAVGFIIVAIISILPEAFIGLNSALTNNPDFGLATLFGSNVADLSLVFALIILLSKQNIKVESKIIKSNIIYPLLLLIPLFLGLDGHFSRPEGLVLILAGVIFYYRSLRQNQKNYSLPKTAYYPWYYSFLLIFSMGLLLVGSHWVVNSAVNLAHLFAINPILIGMLIVGLGTTMPEFIFSLRSIRAKENSLAIGDILGTVLADATVVVGLIALINPFFFPIRIIYLTGTFMLLGSLILLYAMYSGRALTKTEAYWLIIFWLIFAILEFTTTSYFSS